MSEALKRHPLVADNWMSDDEPEFTKVSSVRIADLTRAADAIRTISRIVHNSLGEPDMSGAQPLPRGDELSLLDGLHCLGDYVFQMMDDIRFEVGQLAEARREADHV